MEHITRAVAPPTTEGSGWAVALTDAGYLSKKMHFYVKGERRSACSQKLRKSRPTTPEQQLPKDTEYCGPCRKWIEAHPTGGRRNRGARA